MIGLRRNRYLCKINRRDYAKDSNKEYSYSNMNTLFYTKYKIICALARECGNEITINERRRNLAK